MSYARTPIRVLVLLAFALAIGCKSGVERDVVEREMRQQEDQIYALQDYLSEYQQLLCNARSENAQLKRQLNQGQFREGQPDDRSLPSDTLPEPPVAPPTKPTNSAPGAERSVIPSAIPPLDMDDAGAPPIDDQSANEPEEFASEVQPASAEIEVVSRLPSAVVLRGEVHLGREASGPRVLVEVEPVSDDGEPTEFHGRLSLLVLDPSAREQEQRLARWDFESADLEPMAKRSGKGTSFEFPLQLPADAPRNRPLELWARLEPEDGAKLLGRTTMDLSRAGQFASAEVSVAMANQPKRHTVQAASAEVPIRSRTRSQSRLADSMTQTSDWQTAKPGDRPSPQTAGAATEWKLATRPIPEVEPKPVLNYPRPAAESDRYGAAAETEWSPERPDNDKSEPQQASRIEPAWSPTR